MSTLNLGWLKVQIGYDASELDAKTPAVRNQIKSVEKQGNESSEAVSVSFKKMAVVVVAAMASAAAAMSKAADEMNNLKASAMALGQTTEQFSKIASGVRLAGGSVNDLSSSMAVLAQRMQERDWLSDGSRTFAALGVSVFEAGGKMKSTERVFTEVIDRLSNMQDSIQKTTLINNLLGESGIKLISSMRGGTDQIRRMAQEAELLGATVNSQTLLAFDELNKASSSLSVIFTGVINKVVEGLQPALTTINETYLQGKGRLDLMTQATTVLTVAMKSLITVGNAITTTFSVAYQTIATIAKSVWEIANGNFAKAWETIKSGVQGINVSLLGLADVTVATWSQAWTTTVEFAEKHKKAVAPVVATQQELINSYEDLRVGAMNAYQAVMDDPLATMVDKTNALEIAVRKNIITWRDFNKTMKSVKEQNEAHMNDMLATTSNVLTAMFNQSKSAAIASALINTYLGITKAIASYPPPISYAMAGLQAALGFAQVRQISSSSKGSSGGGSTSVPSVTPTAPIAPAPQQTQNNSTPGQVLTVQGLNHEGLFTGDAVRALADKLIAFQRDGGRVVLA